MSLTKEQAAVRDGFLAVAKDINDLQVLTDLLKFAANITQDSTHRFVTDSQVNQFLAKTTTAEKFLGTYNAATNTPTLSTVGNATIGAYYTVTTAGTNSAVTGASVAFAVGDRIISNGTVWSVIKGEIAGAVVGNLNLLPNAVTADKTTFVAPGTNLYNILDATNIPGKYIDNVGNFITDANNSVSHYIPVTAGSWYTPSYKTNLIYYNAALALIGGEAYNRATDKFQTPVGAAYIRITVPNNIQSTFMVVAGQVLPATYIPFVLTANVETPTGTTALNLAKQSASQLANVNNLFAFSDNLYNPKDSGVETGKYIRDDGVKVTQGGYNISGFIAITPGNSYTVSNIQYACLFAADKVTVVSPGLLVYNRASATFTAPANAYYIRLTVPDNIFYDFMLNEGAAAKPFRKFGAVTSENLVIGAPLLNKTVWVGGTSIPALGLYVDKAVQTLGGTCVNKAVGSSTIRKADKNGSWVNVPWQNVAYCLSMTLAEKNDLIANWSTYRTQFILNPPATLDAAAQAYIRACSYENSLVPYLNGTYPMPDVFYFSHGFNDRFNSETEAEYMAIPAIRNDRNTFIGAQNYIIDIILSYNRRARIMFEGHYENQLDPRVSKGQQVVANYWQFPILKLWEKTGWNQQVVPNSQQYWATAPYSSYSGTGNTSQDMTCLRYWVPDGVHPHTDPSGKAVAMLAKHVENFFRQEC